MKLLNSLIFLFFAFLILLVGCNNEEDLGSIVVNVKLMDENEYVLDDNSGVEITLSRGQELFYGTTDINGDCIFSNFQYGIFNVELEKSGFISSRISTTITRHTSDSLNTYSFRMNEIPHYTLALDSILKPETGENYRMYAYGRISNLKGIPQPQYRAIAYFDTTSDVSKDSYQFYHYTAIMYHKIKGETCELWMTNWTNSYLVPPDAEKLYVRLYPCARYNDWLNIHEEAFGTPSDVFEWVLSN